MRDEHQTRCSRAAVAREVQVAADAAAVSRASGISVLYTMRCRSLMGHSCAGVEKR